MKSLLLIGCLALAWVMLCKNTGGSNNTNGNSTAPASNGEIELPATLPYKVDYPSYEGAMADLFPKQVGSFRRTEANSTVNLGRAIETWSAYYEAANSEKLHLRLQKFASPAEAYGGIVAEDMAMIANVIKRLEPIEKDGRVVGALVVSGAEGKEEGGVVLWTRGNLAFIVSSFKDTPAARSQQFQREYSQLIRY